MMDLKTVFLSCDWGTSAFRLRLVERADLHVLAEESSKEGNAATFERWRQAGRPPAERADFYLAVVQSHLQKLEQTLKTSLAGVPVVMSGMASSTIGLAEVPYKPLPFAADGSDLQTKVIDPTPAFEHETLLISGVKSADDVMRGEEVQLVGCQLADSPENRLFLHPGTHAKHVLVRGGQAVALQTYLTGELFSLLSTKSILAASVEEGGELGDEKNGFWFEAGVRASQSGNVLHNAFLVRTNDLFQKATKQQNYFYLSGLLIGAECRDLLSDLPAGITLAGEPVLVAHYAAALRELGIAGRCPVQTKTAEQVTLHGQLAVLKHRSSPSVA